MAPAERYLRRRVARRRVLAGAAGASLATAILAACGGSSSSNQTSKSGALTKPADTTSQAKPGGTLRDFSRDEGGSFDALSSGDSTTFSLVSNYTYPALVKFSTGKYPEDSSNDILGDLAESWEFSPDRMAITFKLRRGLRWDSKPPVNRREIDANDVVASWKKFSVSSSYAGQVAYTPRNPSASVVSMDAIDSNTVKVNLFRPDPSALSLLGWSNTRILPREFDGGFDARSQVIGYGPYLLEQYQPSVGLKWRRNPDYYVKDRPFVEVIEVPIIPEYATRLSQFRAGAIFTSVVTPEDLLQTKQDLPKTSMIAASGYIPYNGVNLKFGYEGAGARFTDVRIRQAIGYLIDRRAYEDLLTNGKQLAANGIQLQSKFATWLGPYWKDYWLDPFDAAKFGPNSKYFVYNPAEAKKLLSAAGVPDGFETGFFYPAGRGGWQQQVADVLPGLLQAGGIRVTSAAVDNTAVFIPNMLRQYAGGIRATGRATDGLQLIAGGTRVTAALCLQNYYDTGGPSFIGMPVNGQGPELGDAEVVDLVRRITTEFDHEKQTSLSHDFHRIMAEKAYSLPLYWSTPSVDLVWPAIGNYGYFTQSVGGASQAESRLQWWVDSTKAPLV